MIYEKYNFNESFSNATGETRNRMSIFQLGKTITKHPQEVIFAIQDADVNINENANKKEIIKTILNNKRNKQMIQNISAIIFASSSFDGDYSNLDDDKGAGGKGKVMAQIGAFFKGGKERRAKRKADGKPSGLERIRGFLSKNKDTITTIGGSLYEGLQTRQGVNNLNTQTDGDGDVDGSGNTTQQTFFEKNKIYIIGAVLLVGGYFAYKKFYAKK